MRVSEITLDAQTHVIKFDWITLRAVGLSRTSAPNDPTDSTTKMRILAFPKSGIAYNECFYRAVEKAGVTVVDGVLSGGWLFDNVRSGDWIHLHWPSFAYARKEGLAAKVYWFLRFVALLLLARMRGARIAWTAHNLWPHDRDRYPVIDVLGRYLVIWMSAVIFVHGGEALRMLGARFPRARSKATVIPHGNWIEYYTKTCTRDTARRHLGIDVSSYVFLFVGLAKPYKNLDGLIRAFNCLDGDALLIIAGRFPDSAYYEEITRLAQGNRRIAIHARFVPDDEIQYYLVASDAVVLPYREVLTSGAAILAMSFGRPVVSVDLGNLRDLVTKDTGLLFSANDAQGLVEAMRECAKQSFDERVILDRARLFTYDDAARILVDAFRRADRSDHH